MEHTITDKQSMANTVAEKIAKLATKYQNSPDYIAAKILELATELDILTSEIINEEFRTANNI